MAAATARTGEVAAKAVGLDTIGNWFDAKATEYNAAANAPGRAARVQDPTEAVESVGNVVDYITSVVGEQVPQFGVQVASYMLGGAVGKAGGAILGAAAPSFVQNFGSNMQEQKDSGVYEPQVALGAAGLQTALDTALFHTAAARISGKPSIGAVRKTRASLAADIVKGAGIEGITEGAQEGISVLARSAVDPNYPQRRDEIMNRILNAVVGGGILGAGFGGATHFVTPAAAPAVPPVAPAAPPAPAVAPAAPAAPAAPPEPAAVVPSVSPITGEDLNAPFPGLIEEAEAAPEITRGGAQTFQQITLPDVIPPAPIGPVQVPPISRALRTIDEKLRDNDTIAAAFGADTPVAPKTRIVTPVVIGEQPAAPDLNIAKGMAELKKLSGVLLTSDDIRALRGERKEAPAIAIEQAREPRLRGGPAAEQTARSFITDRIDEAASTVLSSLVAQKGISQGTATTIRRMIKNRMPDVFNQDGESRGGQFDKVLSEIVSKTPLRQDAAQFVADVRAEIARTPEKNQLPASARDFVPTGKAIPGAETQAAVVSGVTVAPAPARRTAPLRLLPAPGETYGATQELFGTDARASQAVTRAVALKKGKPVDKVAAEQLTLFSNAAMNLDPVRIAENHNAHGGSSTDPVSGTELAGTRGYVVSGMPGRELILEADRLTPEQVSEYAHANADALSRPGAVLGTWKNKDTGFTHLDVSVISQTLEDAIQIARDSNQLAVWDMRLNVEIPVSHPLLNLAQVYNSQAGLPPRMKVDYAEPDTGTMVALANAYEAMPDTPQNPEVQAAYQAMNQEVKAQYDLLSQTIKIESWPGTNQPYNDSAEMRADVFGNNHLWVWTGGQPNALMTQEENLRHRAVHDLFGHAPTGFEFSPRGEWNAFRVHAQMFSPQALRAFVSESIGQVAYANYHESNISKSAVDRQFPKQKAGLLPETLWRKVTTAPMDAQARVYYDFQQQLAELGEQATEYLTKIIGGREGLELKLQMNGTQYAGRYTKTDQKSVIELALSAKDVMSNAAHEGFHFLEEEVLSDTEKAAVRRELAPGTVRFDRLLAVARAYDKAHGTDITSQIVENPREARAYGFQFWREGSLEASGFIRRAFEKIKAILDKVSAWFAGKPFASMTDVFDAIERGDYSTKRRIKAVATNLQEEEWVSAVEQDLLPGQKILYSRPVASAAKGRPWWVKTGADVRKLRAELKALALEGERGRAWHKRSAEAALVFAKGNKDAAERVAALFANYSPQQRVGFDARSAFIAILKHAQGLPIEGTGARYPERMNAQAQEILDGKSDARGIKRESFFWNMMKYINPEKYPEHTQRATIDMWMSMAFGNDSLAVSDPQYIYGDAETKRLARELGWGVDETQAAIWISIKARMDPKPVRDAAKAIAEKRGWMEDTEVLGKTVRSVKKEHEREFFETWRRIGMSRPLDPALNGDIDTANYAYDNALRDLATGKINLGGTQAKLAPKDWMDTLGESLLEVKKKVVTPRGESLDLFSMAALIDVEDKLRRGEFDKVAAMRAFQELSTVAQPAESKVAKMVGIAASAKYKAGDVLGWFSRTVQKWLASGEYRATQSIGYSNVHSVLTYFDQRKKRLISEAVDGKLSKWRSAATADLDAVSRALLARTMNAYTEDSDGYFALLRELSPEQRILFKQATDMIASELDAEFVADQKVYSRMLGADSAEYAEWIAARGTQVAELKRTGYFPERRYGDHAVNVFVVTPNGKKITIAFESYETASQAKLRISGTSKVPGLKATLAPYGDVGIEYAYRYKPTYDGSVSFQRVMELLEAQGVEVTQAEKERLARALIAADSTKNNRIFRRENVPGASVDGMRVLADFAVANASKVAYSEFGDAINKSKAGRDTRVGFDQSGAPLIAIDETTNLWNHEDPETAGFYRGLVDQKVNQVLQPDNNKLSSGLRALASMQFLGGSIAAGMVQLTSLPMNSVPWLTQHTSYADASAKVYGGLATVMKNGGVFLQTNPATILEKLQALDVPMDGIDNVPGLRQALIIAFQDGTTLDTDIYEIMGLARGQILSLPRTVQKAADLWMLPFRKAEQVNRWSTFIAGYKIGQKKGLTGRTLYEFARKTVDSTQFRYDTVNRPTLANSPIGSLVMTFKSYPIYMTEMILGLAKHDRKAAVIMLGSLWFFAGLEGMPFFEDAEDLIDTIAQKLFRSPFNSQRFLRNMIADASEVVPFIPNADILLRGTVNFLSDANVAGRVGLGNMLPGTRMFAADADYKRTAEEIVGPGLSAVTGWAKFAGAMGQGDLQLALRNAPFLAVQNAAKGYTAFSKGYYTDGRGQKLVDAGPLGTFLQGIGFSPEAVRQAQETANIDRTQNAFYTEFKGSLTKEMVAGLRDGDQEKVQEVIELTRQWNEAHPDMPILLSGPSIRRAVALAGMTLSERTLALLPKQLRYSSETYESQ
jgi:hypothetical protein